MERNKNNQDIKEEKGRLNVSVSQNWYVKALNLNVMVFGSGVFGK